jgi:hypothetical protein
MASTLDFGILCGYGSGEESVHGILSYNVDHIFPQPEQLLAHVDGLDGAGVSECQVNGLSHTVVRLRFTRPKTHLQVRRPGTAIW